ncbi:MAG: potassium channel family protein [Planctomycetota bacterium]
MMQGNLGKSSQREPLEGHEKCKETGDRLFNELVLTIRKLGKLDVETLASMEESYGKLSDVKERYRCLIRGYRAVRLALVESGNSMEAQIVKDKESLAKTSYYWRFGPRSSALWSWLTGPDGLKHFGLLWFSLVFFIFPILYGLGDFVASSNPISAWDYVYFSICTATTLVYGDFMPHGLGKLVAVVEGLFSYFGLGLLFWTLMEKFNDEV